MSDLTIFPSARRDQLVVETLKDEVLIYDLERDQASCLNPTAALVWKLSDGKTGVAEIAKKMSSELGSTVDVRVVWYALEQLDKKHLLVASPQMPALYNQMTRRSFLIKAGIVGAAVTIPVVIALAAPTPAMAETGACFGRSCQSNANCCSINPNCLGAPNGICVT